MAIRSICDTCRAEGPVSLHGLPPKGWFLVRERENYESGDKDYCSLACAIKGLGGIVPTEQAAPSDSELATVVPKGASVGN